MSGFLDFTEVHVQRVERTTYTFEVAGDTLQELGEAAQAEAGALFGNYDFRITSLDVAAGRIGPNERPKYRASVWTEAM